MKTQILKLEIHDDIVSIRDKLTWKQIGRVLLVFPEGRDGGLHKRLNRRIDLLLLKRAAQRLGAQIAFLTPNTSIQKTARELGIPVFEDIEQAHATRWMIHHIHKRPHPPNKKNIHAREELQYWREDIHPKNTSRDQSYKNNQTPPKIHTRVIWLVFALLITYSLGWLCTVPRLDIYLMPVGEIQEISLPVKASTIERTSQVTDELTAKRFSVIIEVKEQAPATGKMLAPIEKARGVVVFHNLTANQVTIPKGTRLASSIQPKVLFETTRLEQLQPNDPDENKSDSSVITPVIAVFPGPLSNLPAASIDVVHGVLAPSLTVTNPSPTSGGLERIVPYPTDQDRRMLSDRVAQMSKKQARLELENAILLSGIFVPGFLINREPEIAHVIEERYIPESEDTPAHTIVYSSRIEYQAWGLTGNDLMSFASLAADAATPPGFQPVVETLEVHHTTSPRMIAVDGSKARSFEWLITVRRKIHPDLHRETLYRDLAFRSPTMVSRILEDRLSLEQPPRVVLSPGWLPFLPPLPSQYFFINNVS